MLDIDCLIEALLFVSDAPLGLDDIARVLGCDRASVEQAVAQLTKAYASRGLRFARSGQQVQIVTAPEATAAVERLLGLDASAKLSTAALETLAIVAYRQPVTRAQIEAVRGVNVDGVIRSLQAKSLIAPVGRLDQAGRPVLYGTTVEFLQYLGIPSLEALPELPEVDGQGTIDPATARQALGR